MGLGVQGPVWRVATLLLLPGLAASQAAITVATIGDSFADGVYLSFTSRPDLVKKHNLKMIRWSRPIIGLARTDNFDYTGWLREPKPEANVDFCVVQIGSNDMQGILLDKRRWAAFGTAEWKRLYRDRVREMAETLRERGCRQKIWLLQPGFEKRHVMAEHRLIINQLQMEALSSTDTLIFELKTAPADYGPDDTHFNREYVLRMGQAMFSLVDALSVDLANRRCFSCHQNLRAEDAVWAQDGAVLHWVKHNSPSVIQRVSGGAPNAAETPAPVAPRKAVQHRAAASSGPAGQP